MTRAVTAPEHAILQSNGQFSILKLIPIVPTVVFVAQTDGVPATNDGVNTIAFVNVSYGVVGSIVEGMTAWIGTTPGAMDIGTVRILTATLTSGSVTSGSTSTGTMTIGITSELQWVDGAYITVADEFLMWPKQAQFEGGVFLVNDGQIYSNQHSVTPPIVIMGPDLVLNMGSAGSISHQVDSSASWVPPGSAVSIGANPATWSVTSASGSASISGSAGAHIQTVTFYTPGNYRLTCSITAGAATGVGHRMVYVYNDATPLTTQMTVDNISGDWQTGGWNFDVTMYGQTDLNTIRDRSRIFLVAEDYYASGSSTVKQSLGPVLGQEHVICNGWIDGETIEWNPELSTVKFKVHGPQWWLQQTASRQTMILDCNTRTPAQWNEMSVMAYDCFLWHVLKWRSTCSEMMDVFPSGDTRHMLGATGPVGTLWGQITQVGEAQQMIHPCCNRYGQLYAQIDLNLQYAAARAAAPVVMDITKSDWRDSIEIERRIVDDVGWQEVTAFSWIGDNTVNTDSPPSGIIPTAYRAGSYGTWLGHYGKTDRRTELLVSVAGGQTETNTLAGILCGNANNDYPRITIPLFGNNRFFDICPNQYGTISMDAADTPLGLTLTNKKFVVRSITMNHDTETGVLNVDITGEGESAIKQGFYLPNPQLLPPTIPTNIPTNPWKRGVIKPRGPGLCTNINAAANGPFPISNSFTVQTTDGGFLYADYPIHLKIRKNGAANPTRVLVTYNALGSQTSGSAAYWEQINNAVNMQVFGLNTSGSPIVQAVASAYSGGSMGTRTFTFAPAGATEVFGFRFQASAGWTDIATNPLNPGGFVTELAVDPTNPQNIYVGAGIANRMLYISHDRGKTWVLPASAPVYMGSSFPTPGVRLFVNPASSSIIYMQLNADIYKSTDGGDNFSLMAAGKYLLGGVYINPDPDQTMLFATRTTGGATGRFYISIDAGASWFTMGALGGLYNTINQLGLTPSLNPIYAIGSDNLGNVFKSADLGMTWAASGTGLPPGGYLPTAIVIDPVTPSTLYVGYVGSGGDAGGFGVYKSTDSAASWTAVNNGFGYSGSTPVTTLTIDPITPSTLYAGTTNGVYKTIDGGANWFLYNDGIPAAYDYIQCFGIDPVSTNILYAGLVDIYKTEIPHAKDIVNNAIVSNICNYYDV